MILCHSLSCRVHYPHSILHERKKKKEKRIEKKAKHDFVIVQ
jgi:hypothetical protein